MVKHKAYKPKNQHRPKKRKRLFSPGMLVGIVLGFLMVTSMFGFITAYTDQSQTTLQYNEFRFEQTTRGFATDVDGQTLEFSYFPESVESISVDQQVIDKLKGVNALTLTYDPESEINQSAALVQYNLGSLYEEALDVYVTRALTNNTLFDSLPQADCEQATQFVPVVKLTKANQTRVSQQGNCILVEATSDVDMIRLQDRISYGLLGVINDG